MQPITISPKDAAELTGLSVRTIYRLMSAGQISSQIVGRRRLIKRQSILQLVTADENVAA